MKRVIAALCAVWTLTSCASLSNRTKTLMLAGVTGTGGAVAGGLTAPTGERPEMHAVLWGAVGALAGTIFGLFFFDEEAKSRELERQNQIMRKELEDIRPDTGGGVPVGRETSSGHSYVRDDLPDSVKSLVQPGQWSHSLFPKDQWVKKTENYLVRECEAFTYVPPTLQLPQARPVSDEGHKNKEQEKQQ